MAGNAVVCKPSEMTTVTAWMLMKLFHEAGTVHALSVLQETPDKKHGQNSGMLKKQA